MTAVLTEVSRRRISSLIAHEHPSNPDQGFQGCNYPKLTPLDNSPNKIPIYPLYEPLSSPRIPEKDMSTTL